VEVARDEQEKAFKNQVEERVALRIGGDFEQRWEDQREGTGKRLSSL